MDPVFDADLLWIAEQAYYAPLPANWEEAGDGDGNIYYFNAMTGTSCSVLCFLLSLSSINLA
jgi:hypothetical protein